VNTAFLGLELKRQFRDYVTLFFTALLPAFFYLIFGAAQAYSSESAGNGNVAMYIMISMSCYGAVTATAGIGGMAALERMQGWSRQLGLTPMRDGQFVLVKTVLALLIALLPIGLIYTLGAVTGARGTTTAWIVSAVIVMAGAAVFALWGLVFGLAFRSEAAISAASGTLVILAFLGNIFFPLSGTLLTIAKFTPLYGYAALARYPVTEGYTLDGTGGGLVFVPLWVPVANVIAWMLVLSLVAVGRWRQRAWGAPVARDQVAPPATERPQVRAEFATVGESYASGQPGQ
jgi:ABC-2 type transport system permease protein